ncbi:hypothetical protein W97_06633 [Coniosporium apollinis CBS 100218]|uniref:Uncharacterized protein n=1 Tax=Coniosporium apollinis (strain CBS 100218) TaxID=1168221 RepID=R7YZJ1_CONA1|nr:uncharacterized protein W97_06633 [Coniosporium apollinis CBS 100218]EON67380.1 hypothetical protein W97_06633 [Coniosporium apollinis CBS 100218]
MESLLHILSKSAAAAAANHQPTTVPTLEPPPAYTAHPDLSSDPEDEEDDCEPSTNITINASTNIQGSYNLIALSHSDPARLVAVVLGALNASSARTSRRGDVHLNINCGITIVGDRNIVGAPAASLLKMKAEAGTAPRPSVADGVAPAGGRKRKADDGSDELPEAKRAKTDPTAV